MPSSRRPRRRWFRRLIWFCAFLLLLASAAVFLPWSPSWVRTRIERTLSERLGCSVTIGRATFHLASGELMLERITLDFSNSREPFAFAHLVRPVWNLREATIHVRPGELLSRRGPAHLYIRLRNPDPIVLAAKDGSTQCFPPLNDWMREPPPSSPGRWQVRFAALEDGAVHFLLPPGGDAKKDRVVLSQILCVYRSEAAPKQTGLTLAGFVGVSDLSPFRVRIQGQGDRWSLRTEVSPIRFGDKGIGRRSWVGRSDRLALDAKAQRKGGEPWNLAMTAFCPRIELLGVVEQDCSITARGRFDDATSRGLVALRARSRESESSGDLDFHAGGLRESVTTVSIQRLAAGWWRLWNERRRPQWPVIEGHHEQMTVAARARLQNRPFRLDQPRVRVALSGVSVSSDYLPFPVNEVDFEGTAEPGRLEIERCRGHWARGWVSLRGAHDGPWLGGWAGTSRVAWDFAVKAEDLLTTLPPQIEARASTAILTTFARRPLVAGDLLGSGTLALGWEQGKRPGAPTTQTLQGVVVLKDGRIEHPALPAPMTNLDGVFAIAPQRFEISSMRGEIAGTTASVSAAVAGEPFFWNDPQAQCVIQTAIPIADALRFAPESVRPKIAAAEPRGHISAVLSLAGPLRRSMRAEDVAASGTVLFRDVSFRSPTWALEGTFHDLQGRLELTESAVRLTTATGWLERVPLGLQAEAAPQAGRFWARLETETDFPALQQVMPRALSRYEVGGTLSGWFELDAFGENLFAQAARLKDLTSETLSKLPFQWGLRGEVRPRDCQLTLESFPTSLTNINGRITMRNYEWTFDDLVSSWGKTENARLRGGGRLRPGSWPVMHMELEAPVLYLDEWIRAWRRSRGSRYPPRVANPVFEMTGIVRGKRAFYRGHPGENFQGEFTLVSPYLTTDKFHFEKTAVDLYDGKLFGQGDIEFKRGASTCTLELTAQNISLPPFLQCESGHEQTFIGRLTGRSTFRWFNADGNTLTGEGALKVTESKFFGNVFFRNLGRLIKIPILDDISFAIIEAPFKIAHNAVTTKGFTMDGPFMSVSGEGTVGFDHSLDFLLEIAFPHLPDYVWPVDWVLQLLGKIPATALWLDLRGTWDNPEYSFHHLDAAEQALLGLVEFVWNTVVP